MTATPEPLVDALREEAAQLRARYLAASSLALEDDPSADGVRAALVRMADEVGDALRGAPGQSVVAPAPPAASERMTLLADLVQAGSSLAGRAAQAAESAPALRPLAALLDRQMRELETFEAGK